MEINVKSEKNLGLIGSVLAVVFPFAGRFGGVLLLTTLILIAVALKGIGDKAGDKRPFKYYIYGIAPLLAGTIVLLVVLISLFMITSVSTVSTFSAPGMVSPVSNVSVTSRFAETGMIILIALIALAVALIVLSAYYGKRAWNAMYEITGVEEFRETAKWLWLGGLTVVLLVGAIMLLVAGIYQIVGFYNMPEVLKNLD